MKPSVSQSVNLPHFVQHLSLEIMMELTGEGRACMKDNLIQSNKKKSQEKVEHQTFAHTNRKLPLSLLACRDH